VVGSDADPASVGRHVVDAVRDRLPELRVNEVVDADLLGLPLRLVLAALVREVADELHLLGLDGDDRIPGLLQVSDLGRDVLELGVSILVPASFLRLL